MWIYFKIIIFSLGFLYTLYQIVIDRNSQNEENNSKKNFILLLILFSALLIENIQKAIKQTNSKAVVLAGGVSANSYIRNEFLKLEEQNIKIYMPDLKLCTDNAAMIASAGYYNFISGKRDKLDLNAVPNIQLGN